MSLVYFCNNNFYSPLACFCRAPSVLGMNRTLDRVVNEQVWVVAENQRLDMFLVRLGKGTLHITLKVFRRRWPRQHFFPQ